MTLVTYVKNTFIEIAHDAELKGSCVPCAAASKRSSSAPPSPSPSRPWPESSSFEPSDLYLTAEQVCATPCIFSPRSDFSTAASSEQNGTQPLHYPAPPSESASATDSSGRASLDSLRVERLEFGRSESPEPWDCTDSAAFKDFAICLKKTEGECRPLGMDVDRSDGISLSVRSVSARGLLASWNQAHPDLQVMARDRIVKVNSTSGSALDLLRECRKSNVLRMRVLRNARPELIASHCIQKSTIDFAADRQAARRRHTHRTGLSEASCPGEVGKVVVTRQAAATLSLSGQSQATCATSLEILTILRAAVASLNAMLSRKAKSVLIVEGTVGASSAINIELRPLSEEVVSHDDKDVQDIVALVKCTLLESAARSQSTYIVGYLGTPFCAVGDLSFRCTIAKVINDTDACWDFYQKGFCPRPSSCRWRHPELTDLMSVWVNLKL